MIKFTDDFKNDIQKPSNMPVGTTFVSIVDNEKHIILKTYSGYVSLNDPDLTWSLQQAFDNKIPRYVDIEVKVL